MKILYVCHESLPSPHTNTEQLIKTVSELSKHQCQIDLIYPANPRRTDPTLNREKEIASFYGIEKSLFDNNLNLVELPVPCFIRGKTGRPIHDIRASLYGCNKPYDLMYVRDPFSLLTALLSGKKTIFETYRCDINRLNRYRAWRSFCYSKPNLLGLVVHSRMAQQSFIEAGISNEKILVAHNGCSPQIGQPSRGQNELRESLHLPRQKKLIMYTGHIGRAKGIDDLLLIAKKLIDAHFVFVGGMPKSRQFLRLSRRIRLKGIANITLIPRVPPAHVNEYLNTADCLIIPPSSKPLLDYKRTVLPLKTFQYLAAGRPILAPDLPDIREILSNKHNAILVPPDSPDQAVEAIRNLFNDRPLQEKISRNAEVDALKHTWKNRAEKISHFLHDRMKIRAFA